MAVSKPASTKPPLQRDEFALFVNKKFVISVRLMRNSGLVEAAENALVNGICHNFLINKLL